MSEAHKDAEREALEVECTCNAIAGEPHNEACPVTHAVHHAFHMSGENARAASTQAPAVDGAEAIYQRQGMSFSGLAWVDVSAEEYGKIDADIRRIVYASPAASSNTLPRESEGES